MDCIIAISWNFKTNTVKLSDLIEMTRVWSDNVIIFKKNIILWLYTCIHISWKCLRDWRHYENIITGNFGISLKIIFTFLLTNKLTEKYETQKL